MRFITLRGRVLLYAKNTPTLTSDLPTENVLLRQILKAITQKPLNCLYLDAKVKAANKPKLVHSRAIFSFVAAILLELIISTHSDFD